MLRILWHIGPLLGNDRETNIDTTDVVRQCPVRNKGSTVGSGVFYVVRSETISRDRPSSAVSAVQRSEDLVGELVSQRTAIQSIVSRCC
jgi:hypothetical protein